MGFKKIKAKVKHARGAGPDLILKTLKENHADFMESLTSLDETEKNQLLDKFNAAGEGFGDAVFADKEDFEMTETDWDADAKAKFCNVLVPDYFEVNADDDEQK